MDPQDGRRPRAALEGSRVVAQVGAVGGADLDQPGAALLQDLGDPERAADLDQLAARHQHLAAGGQGGERHQHGGGAIVDHQRRLGAGEAGEPALDPGAALTAPPGGEVELETRVAPRHLLERRARRGRQRGAAEIGVEHHTGGVEHPPQRRLAGGVGARRGPLGQGVGGRRRAAAAQAHPLQGQLLAYCLDHQQARQPVQRARQRGMAEQRFDRGESAQTGALGHGPRF